jgi:hypothetical protein
MALTNQNVVAISKFAMKAKKHIGLVKLADMSNDRQYACDILIKAVLTDDSELIQLAKAISDQFDVGIDLINSVESYINNLLAKDAHPDFIRESKSYLIKLAIYLYDIKMDGATYRQAVEQLLSIVDAKERTFCINLAREFYPFWRHTNKHADEHVINADNPKESFIKLWNSIDHEFFSDSENEPLNQYVQSMKDIGISENDIHIRQKIAKVISLEIRNQDQSLQGVYRNAIDGVQGFFSYQDMRGFFLVVSREFHSFWIGNREVEKYMTSFQNLHEFGISS